MTELGVVSVTGATETAMTGVTTAWLSGCSPLAETTDSFISGIGAVIVLGVDCSEIVLVALTAVVVVSLLDWVVMGLPPFRPIKYPQPPLGATPFSPMK